MVRRAVAGVAILVVVIVLALGVHSCQVSSRNSALRSYNSSVGTLISQSDGIGNKVFQDLTGPQPSQEVTLQTDLNSLAGQAGHLLQQAENLSPPSEVSHAQQNLVTALSLRRDGITDVAAHFEPALSRSTAQTGITDIAIAMQKFLTSDVLYTTQTATGIAAALHAAGIAVGPNGETIQATTFLPDIGWLTPTYVAHKLGSTVAAGGSSCPTGDTCGHSLNTVSVGGVQLSTGGGNTIPASPPPTFTANITNGGQVAESDVKITVSVSGSSGGPITASATKTTQPGQTYSVQVTLGKAPPTGSGTVTVTIGKVPGESNVANNTLTFPVTFA